VKPATSPVMVRSIFLIVAVTLAYSTVSTRSQEPLGYTALGDSIATGYLTSAGYVSLYRDALQSELAAAVTLYNLAQNGSTSGRLLNALRTNTVFHSAIEQSAVVTWNAGLVDFRNARTSYKSRKCGKADNQDCLRTAVATFKSNWDEVVREMLIRRSTGDTLIRTMDVFNPWVAIDARTNTFADNKEPAASRGTDLQVLKFYLDQINTHIAASAETHGIAYASVYHAFNGETATEDAGAKGFIGSDGIHPTEAGHAVIADLLRGLGYAPLR
jgi:lysophospholipase L1-like esterase